MRWSSSLTRFISRYILSKSSASAAGEAPETRRPSSSRTQKRPSAGSAGARFTISSVAAAFMEPPCISPEACLASTWQRHQTHRVAEAAQRDVGAAHPVRSLVAAIVLAVAKLQAEPEVAGVVAGVAPRQDARAHGRSGVGPRDAGLAG